MYSGGLEHPTVNHGELSDRLVRAGWWIIRLLAQLVGLLSCDAWTGQPSLLFELESR